MTKEVVGDTWLMTTSACLPHHWAIMLLKTCLAALSDVQPTLSWGNRAHAQELKTEISIKATVSLTEASILLTFTFRSRCVCTNPCLMFFWHYSLHFSLTTCKMFHYPFILLVLPVSIYATLSHYLAEYQYCACPSIVIILANGEARL